MKINRLPNGKTDVNNNGAFSTDYVGGSWNYPGATFAHHATIQRTKTTHKVYSTLGSHERVLSLAPKRAAWDSHPIEFADSANCATIIERTGYQIIGYVLSVKPAC